MDTNEQLKKIREEIAGSIMKHLEGGANNKLSDVLDRIEVPPAPAQFVKFTCRIEEDEVNESK